MNFACQNEKLQRGYTLIEILVVVGVIGVLTTLGVSAYNNFNEKRLVRKAADELKSYLRLAASKALNNEKDCTVCGGTDGDCSTFLAGDKVLEGWYLDFSSTPKIYGRCGGTDFGEKTFLTEETTSDLVISAVDETIQFYPLDRGTDLAGDLTINLTQGENSVVLTVAPNGNVY
jgi:prepilin-type N-terminal cleavage/methylation domain-containing protein